jgi:hypothetical protein
MVIFINYFSVVENMLINIILKRIYDDKLISTKLTKRTLKKLILDSSTKTIFSLSGHLYKQMDGVSMGPTLANIIMTVFEQEVVKPLINSGLIRFYKRFVDDTLILMRPSDVQLLLTKFNSFHPNLQFESPLTNSATMASISLTSTSILLELLSIESPLILVNTPTYQASHPGQEKLLGSVLS